MQTRRLPVLLASAASLLLIAGCQQQEPRAVLQNVQTVDNVPPRALPVQPQPELREEATEIKPPEPAEGTARPRTSPSPSPSPSGSPGPNSRPDVPEQMPFSPLIAMDPVDGSKVSIRSNTPITEYENKLYYFSSETNKRAFVQNPQQYLKGQLARY